MLTGVSTSPHGAELEFFIALLALSCNVSRSISSSLELACYT